MNRFHPFYLGGAALALALVALPTGTTLAALRAGFPTLYR